MTKSATVASVMSNESNKEGELMHGVNFTEHSTQNDIVGIKIYEATVLANIFIGL